jgi:stage V sporulation protein B
MIAMVGSIAIAVLVYLFLTISTRAITIEDMKLIPKGEKIARLLKIH